MTDREDELRDALARVEERVARACAAAGRDRSEVTVVVVTKTYPLSDVRLLAGLGIVNRPRLVTVKVARRTPGAVP